MDNLLEKHLSTLPNLKLKAIKGLVLHFYSNMQDIVASNFQAMWEIDPVKGYGIHYAIDENFIVEFAPKDNVLYHLIDGNATYISRALYESKPNDYTVGLLICLPKDQDYAKIENRLIQFCAEFLYQNNLTTDALWREFDLNGKPSPLMYLDDSKWGAKEKYGTFVYEVQQYLDALKGGTTPSAPDTILTDTICREIILSIKDPDAQADSLQPYDRGIKEIIDSKASINDLKNAEMKSIETATKNNMFFAVTQDSPGPGEHCKRPSDVAAVKIQSNVLNVDPIYPDLIVPPGTSTSFNNDAQETESQDTAVNSILSIEEYERRQKIFNPKELKDAVKEVTGKPVNNNDPYPVDEKIKQLESHSPKVKIDEVQYKFQDCNHPGCLLGAALSKSLTMLNDMAISQSKRTEKRLVLIENTLSTVLRNVARLSSRVNINCVYYGGQDVFGKYKCIRCLHPDRVEDGQSMTLDQCVSCSRYEPIIGQIYDILDETGQNVAQILDDNQMSYRTIEDYIEFTRTEVLHNEPNYANLKENAKKTPEPFSEQWPEGFKMDWNEVQLETEQPNVNEYNIEKIVAGKKEIDYGNQAPPIDDGFIDTRASATSYEENKYGTEQYNIEGFAKNAGENIGGVSEGDVFGMNTNDIRAKILARAKEIVDLCQAGKAHYRQVRPAGTISDGLPSWDCSSFAYDAYKAAGLTIGTWTGGQYPQCVSGAGGIIIPIANEKDALPGDLIFFSKQNPLPTNLNDLSKIVMDSKTGIYHVGVYIGNGEMYEASGKDGSGGPSPGERPIVKQIVKSSFKNRKQAFCFARPAVLVKKDKEYNDYLKSVDVLWDPKAQQIPQDLITKFGGSYTDGHVATTLNNMTKYGYKDAVIEESKKQGVDPYLILAIIATESEGNPNAGGPDPGLMQVTGGATGEFNAALNIRQGITHFLGKVKAVGTKNLPMAIYAYNSGQGTVLKTVKEYGLDKNTITGGAFAPFIRDYVAKTNIVPYPEVRYSYYSKVLFCYNLFKKKKTLG